MNSEESQEPICERCRQPIDDCQCTCPYCGETTNCLCCIGDKAVTGG